MIKFIVNNVQSIIVALIFVTIIEMLLPNNSNKKYIKMVGGIYIVFTILNPFLEIFNKNLDIKIFQNFETVETTNILNKKQLTQYYTDSLKLAIKSSLETKGYKINELNLKLNEDSSEILKIEIKCVDIKYCDEIKQFLFQNYGIDLNNIVVN